MIEKKLGIAGFGGQKFRRGLKTRGPTYGRLDARK